MKMSSQLFSESHGVVNIPNHVESIIRKRKISLDREPLSHSVDETRTIKSTSDTWFSLHWLFPPGLICQVQCFSWHHLFLASFLVSEHSDSGLLLCSSGISSALASHLYNHGSFNTVWCGGTTNLYAEGEVFKSCLSISSRSIILIPGFSFASLMTCPA